MTESVFETVEKSCQILKLDFSSAELAILAQEQELTPEQLQAVGLVMDHLRQKKVDTTIHTLLKMSRLPLKNPKTFENFDFSVIKGRDIKRLQSLPSLSAIYSHRNLAFIGPPGTGKTHLAQAFGYECCQRSIKTYFIKMSELRDKFTAARRAGKEAAVLNGLVRPSCLIIDEVGHCEFDKENTRLFFDLIDRRYNKEGKGIRTISLVIETNIRNSIIANAKQGDAQVYLAALEFVAHHMYFNLRSEYISISELDSTIAIFNTKRKAKVNAKNFYTTCVNAKILAEQGDSFDISFSSKNTLAYFVAKYVARELERNPSGLDDINYIMSHICFGINDIIILFLSFITSNVSIIIKIAITAYNLLSKYPELDFDTNNIPFLKNGKAVPATLPSPQEKAQHNKNTEAIEKVRHDAVSFRGIFDFDEDDVEKEKFRVVRAFKYTQVIARTLVDQFGNLEADELDAMTNALYSLPQRVLFALLAPYQNHYEKIVAELKCFADERLPELKLSEKKIKEQFAEAAVILALNVMNDIAFNASDPNTVDVLREYQVSNTNHQIQRLMMVENAGDTNAFVGEALSLFKQCTDDPFAKYLIWYIARKHIIHTEGIDKRQVDRLVSGGVFEVKGKRRLLLEQGKQEKG